MTYKEWIEQNVPDFKTAYGNCEEVCKRMMEAFPELTLAKGHYHCLIWGERMHWWLKDQNGSIIDPTAIQFPTKEKGVYVQWNENDTKPTGKCPNCGEYIWDGSYVHEECRIAFLVSLGLNSKSK